MPAKKPSPAKKKTSQQNQIIGYAVLGGGVLALLLVAVLAFHRFAPQGGSPSDGGNSVTEERIEKEGRPPHLTPAMVEGDWETVFLDYTSVFQAREGTFQILARRSFATAPVYYARGTYTLDGAFMTMTPDNALGSPAKDDPKNRYLHLGHRPFTVEIRFKDNHQIWFSGPADPDFPTRNPQHPLIQFSGKDYIVWTPRNAVTPPATAAP